MAVQHEGGDDDDDDDQVTTSDDLVSTNVPSKVTCCSQ